MELIIGSHVSYLKNNQLVGCVESALSYGANTFMFYTGSTQSTARFDIDEELKNKAYELMKKNNINPENVIVHAPYIVNLANNSDERKYDFYINFLKNELLRCDKLGFDKLVLHPGSMVTIPYEEAITNIAYGLDIALEGTKANILLEYMSGKGTEVGSSIKDLKNIISKMEKKDRVFICLDTCHMNDSGVDISNIDEFLDEFDKEIGLDKIKCVHINDSKNVIGARKDRHENIGYGTIGFDNLLKVIYNERLKGIPMILETPYVNDKAPYKEEIEMIREKKYKGFIK